MMVASERGISRAAQFVAEGGENGIDLLQRAEDPIGLAQRQQGVTKLEAEVHGLLSVSGVSGNFFRTINARSKKRAASAFA